MDKFRIILRDKKAGLKLISDLRNKRLDHQHLTESDLEEIAEVQTDRFIEIINDFRVRIKSITVVLNSENRRYCLPDAKALDSEMWNLQRIYRTWLECRGESDDVGEFCLLIGEYATFGTLFRECLRNEDKN